MEYLWRAILHHFPMRCTRRVNYKAGSRFHFKGFNPKLMLPQISVWKEFFLKAFLLMNLQEYMQVMIWVGNYF